MLNHFWTLCKICPSVGIDKLHSEYRSTYKWHEYHSPAITSVIRRAPSSSGGIGSIEGSPAKRQQTQVIFTNKQDGILNGSAGGKAAPAPVTTTAPRSSQANQAITGQAKTYQTPPANHKESQQQPQTPRKSKSMGRIHGGIGGSGGDAVASKDNAAPREGIANPLAAKDEASQPEAAFRGHRRVPSDGVAWRHSKDFEGERGGMDEDGGFFKRTYKSEYRKKFRPFSQYQYIDGKFQKSKNDEIDGSKAWYKEVLELRRQAGQYRAKHDSGKVWETVQCRGWGVETASDRMNEIYSKQVELWEQVSKRSSLQALSLATSAAPSRPISKAEKELENSRRSSPLKHSAKERHITSASKPPKPVPLHKTADKSEPKTSKETTPRHYYDKTSGSAGHFITSPTRVKLDPACPYVGMGSMGGRTPRKSPSAKSPTKDFSMKKTSPRTISVAKVSPTKEKKSSLGRSVSVGPENRSPKRISRPPSSHAPPPVTKNERRPRPTSLSANSRRKDNTVAQQQEKRPIKKPFDIHGSPKRSDFKAKEDKKRVSLDDAKKSAKDGPLKDATDAVKDSFSARKATPENRFYADKYDPVVKTPPEPTRVKSPDQVLVKSPDPVNWTVPLDTGKTFTVTHNIPEGSPTKRLAKGEASRSTSSSEHRSRQTPEPTKVYQGSIAGTPITTAGTVMPSEPIAVTSSASSASSVPKVEDKSKLAQSTKASDSSKLSKDIEPSISKSTVNAKAEASHSVTFNENVTTAPSKVTNEKLASSEKQVIADKKPSDVQTFATDIKPAQDVTKLEDLKESQSFGTSTNTREEPFSSKPSYNNIPSSGFSTETQDPMTMSVFGSLNGVYESPKTTNQVKEAHTNPTTTDSKPISSVIPGSNLRRLDDPFLESNPLIPASSATAKTSHPVAPPVDPMTSSTYKVLEAPPLSLQENKDNKPVLQEKSGATSTPYRVLEAPVSVPPVVKPAPYRVLEDPMADFSTPKSEPVKEAVKQPPPPVAAPSGKTMAESLDNAHNRFDSHWSASDTKATGNV